MEPMGGTWYMLLYHTNSTSKQTRTSWFINPSVERHSTMGLGVVVEVNYQDRSLFDPHLKLFLS